MDDEIGLISDGDGLAVIGEPAAVERFLASEGLLTRAVGLPRLGSLLTLGAIAAQAGSEIAANSGRWLKLTEESAQRIKKYGLMESKTPGVSHAMVGQPGSIKSWLQVVKGPGSLLTNPALLATAAGVMAQFAMQQTMNEITDYLATIDEKVDDVLRAQKDAVLARMDGAGSVIEEAMTTREHGGRVNEVTWSKVQATPATIAETQAYALRQLDALAEKLERGTRIGDLAEAAKDAESKAQEWLAVLARSFQLQDAIAVIELDRVLDAAPEDLDGHRLGLKAARQDRLELISRSTKRLMARMDAAASRANAKVLLHPTRCPELVYSRNHVALAVGDFHGRLGIERGQPSLEARRWAAAASEVRSKVLETGSDGVNAARRLGNETVDRARSARGELSRRIAERPLRRRGDDKGEG
jgi:predicted transcriptional regulator